MKKLMMAFAVACAAVVAKAEETSGSFEVREGEIHPDWETIVGDGTKQVSIPAGETWVANADDMAFVNKFTNNRFFIGTGSTFVIDIDREVEFFGSTGALGNSANGRVVKRGKGTLVQVCGMYSYKGSLVIENGVVKQTWYYLISCDQGAHITILDGGTLHLTHSSTFGNDVFEVAGNGYNGMGAIVIDAMKEGVLANVTLARDAFVVQNVAGSAFSSSVKDGQCVACERAMLSLNGNKLTVGGTAATVGFSKVDAMSSGTIELAPLANAAARTLKIAFDSTLGDSTQLALPANAIVCLHNAPSRAITASIAAAGDLLLTYAHDSAEPASALLSDYNVWSGGIQLVQNAVLTIDPADASRKITVSGPVSGAGAVQFGKAGALAKGAVCFTGNNSYTGGTSLHGDSTFRLFLGRKSSIPDYATLTPDGSLFLALEYDGEDKVSWTADDVLALASSQNQTTVLVDASKARNLGDLTITGGDVEKYYNPADVFWTGFGATGGYTLTGPYDATSPLNLNVTAGTVRLSGDETITLGEATVSGTSASSSGMLLVDGAKKVVYGSQTFTVGSTSTSLTSPVARMLVTNAMVTSTCENGFTTFEQGALFVGRNAKGVLEVEDGATVACKLVVGGGKTFSQGDGVGAVYQRGGLVTPYFIGSDNNAHLDSNIGNAGHGSYVISGGRFSPVGYFVLGGYTSGVFQQEGGEVEFNSDFNAVPLNGGKAVYAVLNGTTKVQNGGVWSTVKGNGGSAVISVSGANALISVKGAFAGGILYNCNKADQNDVVQYNLNDGGVFEWGCMYMYGTSYSSQDPLRVTFNGGVHRNIMGGGTSPFGKWDSKHPAKVVVFEKGAVIETETAEMAITNDKGVLEGATGGGLMSVTVPEGGVPGFYAVPRVDISDATGNGASAVALVDSATFRVTNVLITCRGWGYSESPTVTLRYNNSTQYTFPSDAVSVADNVAGGLTFNGPGTFTVSGANSWAQWTRVLGGTLKAGSSDGIPSGTQLTLANDATLDLDNVSVVAFTGVDGSGGTVANGTLKIVGEWEISAKKFIARETTAVSGTIDLTQCTGITLVDTELLDEEAKSLKSLRLFTGTQVLGLDNVEVTGAPKGWKISKSTTGIRLGVESGLVLLVR